MINKIILVGNVGQEPEVRAVSEGVKVASFSLATSESYNNKQGEKITATEWHNITVWRGLAEVVEKYVSKGMPLYIEGKITYRSYEADGVTKYRTEIIANELKMLGGKKSNSQAPGVEAPAAPTQPAEYEGMTPEEADDLPF